MKIKFAALLVLICTIAVSQGKGKKVYEEEKVEIVPMEATISWHQNPPGTYKIRSTAELAEIDFAPGDVVTFSNGIYNNIDIVLSANGTADKPITFRGEEAGKVVFTGASSLKIGGQFIIVENIYFRDIIPFKGSPVIDFAVKNVEAKDCKLYNCAISGNGLPASDVDNVWVQLRGQRNTVERCTFDNKMNMGQIMVVLFSKETPTAAALNDDFAAVAPSHRIINNYFRRENSNLEPNGGPDSRLNGQETIRIGTGAFSEQAGNCTVESNTFYRCDAEAEAISNKTWLNFYGNNLFLECKGALTIRQGDNCIVENNYFIGNGREGTGGVRVTGNNQVIRNNYFENTGGEKYFAAICLIRGLKNPDSKPVPEYHYAPVVNGLFEGNVLVNCNQGINIAYGVGQNIGSEATFKNNIVYNDNSTNPAIIYNADEKGFKPSKITWIDNTIYGGTYVNPSKATLPAQTKTKPTLPSMGAKWALILENSGADFLKVSGL